MHVPRKLLALASTVAVVATMLGVSMAPASATKPDPNHRVTICHRTRAANHPYVQITVDEASVNGEDQNPASDHSSHDGPVPTSLADAAAIKAAGEFWGDIIPDAYENGAPGNWTPQNWGTDGQTIFANGCRFPDETFVGLRIVKTVDPGIIQQGESFTFTFVVTVQGGNPTVDDDVVGSCDITIDSNSSIPGESSCLINGLDPNTTYTVYETNTGGFADQDPQDVTTGNVGEENVGVEFDNTFGPAAAQACKVTDVNGTGHNASGDSFTFELLANGQHIDTVLDDPTDPTTLGVQPDIVTVAGGGTAENPNCGSFASVLDDDVNYTISETASPTGYSQDSFACDVNGTSVNASDGFTPEYPDDADALLTCTAVDSIQPADATVQKVTNPTGHLSGWTFNLKANGTTVASGTTDSTGFIDFGVTLQDGVTYTITEVAQTWWRSNGGVGDCSFTVNYPADSGKTFLCTFTNTEYTNGLTIGYWKNHLAQSRTSYCPSRLPNGTSCSTSGPWTYSGLPQTVGGMSIPKTTAGVLLAANVLANNDCGGSTGKSAVNCLAAQLLAAKLNVANGANTCANGIISDANSFLNGGTVDSVAGVTYTVTPYAGSTISNAQKAEAVKLKTYLDTFNNGTCPI
jgi:hypothetical protein